MDRPRKLFKVSICSFKAPEICKKGYMEIAKKNLP